MKFLTQNLLTSGHTFSADEYLLKTKYKYLNIMLLFACFFVPPSIVIGYFLEGLTLTLIYCVTFFLIILSFLTLRRSKKYYDLAVWIYILAPTIMISAALFLSENNFTRVILPLFPVIVSYFFLDKRSALIMVAYALLLIAASLWVDIGMELKDWISTVLLIIMITFIFRFYQEMNEEDSKALSLMNQKLQKLTVTDKLTAIKNRRGLDHALSNEIIRFERFNRPFSLIMADIDLFKQINDCYGHLVGDRILQEIAAIFQDHIRDTDILGRWGGEEFLIICPETDIDGSIQLAQTLRSAVEKHSFPKVTRVTASFGLDTVRLYDKCDKLIERVDTYLYQAKDRGRNCVCSLDKSSAYL